jgi:dihydrodipicolinate synthase/N-acetylneuraminate lyase
VVRDEHTIYTCGNCVLDIFWRRDTLEPDLHFSVRLQPRDDFLPFKGIIEGLTLSPTEIASLADVGVHFLKDTSGNAPAFTELLFQLDDQITAFNGWDTITFYGLAAGAKGSVWGATNVIPELSVELWNVVAVKGDLNKGRELWRKIFPVCKFLESYNYPSAVKTGTELRGWETGGLRKPFKLLGQKQTKEFAQILEAAGAQVQKAKRQSNGV